jgi:hypothetical protein
MNAQAGSNVRDNLYNAPVGSSGVRNNFKEKTLK